MEVKPDYDLIVCGGGLAGTAAAITRRVMSPDARVLLLEAGSYPRHKVCGEYLSPEATSLLQKLLGTRFSPEIRIEQVALHASSTSAQFKLSSPAFSISRYDLDSMLWKRAQELGIECRQNARVLAIARAECGYAIETRSETLRAKCAIDASGRWSELSANTPPGRKLIGIKCHYKASGLQLALCSLYFFRGGYLGFQAISSDCVDAAALVDAQLYRDMPSILEAAGVAEIARDWRPCFAPITCAPVRLGMADPIRSRVFCCGDAAGFIDPFAGDGMSLAMHSGALAARYSLAMTAPSAGDRERWLTQYEREYRRRFGAAFRSASWLRRFVFAPEWMQRLGITAMRVPAFSRLAFKQTRAR